MAGMQISTWPCSSVDLVKMHKPSTVTIHDLPNEVWQLIVDCFAPTRKTYVVNQPWKRTASESTLTALTQVCRRMRRAALPLVWKYVYLETMEEWGLLWKSISPESGQHICAFVNFWTTPALPLFALDDLERRGKDLLWYAFSERAKQPGLHLRRYHSDIRVKSGPDNRGMYNGIIKSPKMYLRACKDVSSMWSRKLHTIYWDASTSFSVDVMLNIRRIQESNTSDKRFPGLESLWIDFFEEMVGEESTPRLLWTFKEPIWMLGDTTLGQLKFFSLGPPYWPTAKEYGEEEYGVWNRIVFGNDPLILPLRSQVPPLCPLETFSEDSGPGRLLRTLRPIRPQIFFGSSRAPFECKQLLPCWARLRCIHIFDVVTITNDEECAKLDLVMDSHFFGKDFKRRSTRVVADYQIVYYEDHKIDRRGDLEFVRAAIRLRPTLEQMYQSKGCQPLTGIDIISHASSTSRTEPLRWTEDWQYICHWAGPRLPERTFPLKSTITTTDVPFATIREWLCDLELASQVADSFNKGIHDKAAEYPFRHPAYPGMLHQETSACCLQNTPAIWLDRHLDRSDHSLRRTSRGQ